MLVPFAMVCRSWILGVLLASALPAVAEAPAKVSLSFKETPWPEVLQWLAGTLELKLQMNDAPLGSFTYTHSEPCTPAQAFEIVHTTLLDRGYTLIRQQGQLLVVLLAEDLHWTLAPFVPVSEIAELPASEMVTTTIPLNTLTGKEAATELGPTLSPRGKIAGTSVGSRLAVCDQAGVIRQLIDLLLLMDPPANGPSVRLKVFKLKYAEASPTATLLGELAKPLQGGDAGPGSGDAMGSVMDFQQMGRGLFNRETMSSFVPGMSFKGVVADKPKKPAETRITVDRSRNIVLVTAEPGMLAMVAKIVEAVDVPAASEEEAFSLLIHRYEVSEGNANDLAQQLTSLFAGEQGFLASGSGSVMVARGTAEQHERIANILARLKRAETKLTAFPVGNRDAELLTLQLEKLFAIESEDVRPTFIADPVGQNILVRGTTRQIEEVRRFLEKGELKFRPQ